MSGLKGQCHEIFCFWYFSWISFPPAPEYSTKTVSNFFENSRRYSQVKEHHRYQRHRWQNCHRCQGHRRQIFLPVSLAVLILVANLPPVSTILAAICHRYQWRQWQIATGINNTGGKFATGANDTGGKQWETLSNCWQLKLDFLYANYTTQRCPKEIITIFLIEDFFHLPPVSTTPMANFKLRISRRIFEKIWNCPNGNWFMKKTRSEKSRETVSLRSL